MVRVTFWASSTKELSKKNCGSLLITSSVESRVLIRRYTHPGEQNTLVAVYERSASCRIVMRVMSKARLL